MKKIYVLAGVVLFIVLVISVWIFFYKFYDFASDLGEGAEEAALDEKNKFIGTWETTYIAGDDRFVGYNGLYIFSVDGTGSIGTLSCTWDISDEKLEIYYYEGFSTLIYDYSFSDDENTLTLTNSAGSLDFVKRLT